MNTAKIAKLCNEIEEIVTAIANWSKNWQTVDDCRTVCDKLEEIAAEISEPPKTNADRIRQMTDEELAAFMIVQVLMGAASANGISDRQSAENLVKEVIKSKSAEIDIENAKDWLKQEVSEDAGTD